MGDTEGAGLSYRSGKRTRTLYVLGTIWGVCLLGAALTGCALFTRKTPEVTPTLAPTSTPQQPPSQTRVKEWVQTSAADFGTGEREGLAISDADAIMPPKSTWFEPKLRSGLLIHTL